MRDIDDQPAATAWASEVEDPHGQPGSHSQADRGVSLEAPAPRDLTEGREPRDVGQLEPVRRCVGGCAGVDVVVIGPDNDLDLRRSPQRNDVTLPWVRTAETYRT